MASAHVAPHVAGIAKLEAPLPAVEGCQSSWGKVNITPLLEKLCSLAPGSRQGKAEAARPLRREEARKLRSRYLGAGGQLVAPRVDGGDQSDLSQDTQFSSPIYQALRGVLLEVEECEKRETRQALLLQPPPLPGKYLPAPSLDEAKAEAHGSVRRGRQHRDHSRGDTSSGKHTPMKLIWPGRAVASPARLLLESLARPPATLGVSPAALAALMAPPALPGALVSGASLAGAFLSGASQPGSLTGSPRPGSLIGSPRPDAPATSSRQGSVAGSPRPASPRTLPFALASTPTRVHPARRCTPSPTRRCVSLSPHRPSSRRLSPQLSPPRTALSSPKLVFGHQMPLTPQLSPRLTSPPRPLSALAAQACAAVVAQGSPSRSSCASSHATWSPRTVLSHHVAHILSPTLTPWTPGSSTSVVWAHQALTPAAAGTTDAADQSILSRSMSALAFVRPLAAMTPTHGTSPRGSLGEAVERPRPASPRPLSLACAVPIVSPGLQGLLAARFGFTGEASAAVPVVAVSVSKGAAVPLPLPVATPVATTVATPMAPCAFASSTSRPHCAVAAVAW